MGACLYVSVFYYRQSYWALLIPFTTASTVKNNPTYWGLFILLTTVSTVNNNSPLIPCRLIRKRGLQPIELRRERALPKPIFLFNKNVLVRVAMFQYSDIFSVPMLQSFWYFRCLDRQGLDEQWRATLLDVCSSDILFKKIK